MAQVEIKVPSVGESITEATVGRWNFKSGDYVEKDQTLFELETEKATMEVSAPASGKLNIQVEQGTTVKIGSVVGTVDDSAAKGASAPAGASASPAKPAASASAPSAAKSTPAPTPAASTGAAFAGGGMDVSDDELKGLGPAKRKAIREGKAPMPSSGGGGLNIPAGEGEERKPMSTIRKKIAERLVFSQQSTATLTTFNEVDMSNILKIRAEIQDEFTKKFGVKLGFMSFFTKACAHAAKEVPAVNARLDGSDVVYNKHFHAGVAVSTDRGLVVPVLRNAERLSYADIEKGIGALAEKARTGKLGIEEMMGGTFTVTNGGVFGSLLSTPILNPPQSGILGMHKTEHRPMAIPDGKGGFTIEVRPMMYVALSYDHRLIDGRESVTFLVKAKEYLETVSRDEILKG